MALDSGTFMQATVMERLLDSLIVEMQDNAIFGLGILLSRSCLLFVSVLAIAACLTNETAGVASQLAIAAASAYVISVPV